MRAPGGGEGGAGTAVSVAAMIMKAEVPWSNREMLITGMLSIVRAGILRDR